MTSTSRRRSVISVLTMVNEATIREHVLQVLTDSYLPLSVSEIAGKISSLTESSSPVPPEQTYSPHRKYKVGQRFFHPAEKYCSWFVVEELVNDKRLIARFDSGETKKLACSDPRVDYYRFTAEYRERELEKLIEESLSQMTDVVTVGGVFTFQSRLQQLPLDRLSDPCALAKLSQLRAQCRPDDKVDQLRSLCQRYGLAALYYLVPLENLPSIFKRGILPESLAPPGHVSFANEEIQAKRHNIRIRDDLPLTLHDCVPLFFAPRPPLLYSLREKQHEIVYILVNPIVLLEPGVVFSPVNARSAEEFFTDIVDLEKLDWKILRARYWGSDDGEQHRQNKLLRQAEAQIPVVVPVNKFLGLGVYDNRVLQLSKQMVVEAGVSLPVERNRSLYY